MHLVTEAIVDWQEPMVLQHKLRPSIARVNGQLDPWHAANKHTTAPINYTRPSPRKHSPDGAARASKQTCITAYYSVYRPRKDEMLSRPGGWLHTEIKCRLRDTSPIPVLTGLDME